MGCQRHGTVNDPCYICRLEQEMRRFMPRDPRYRYWVGEDGWHYGWTTERMGDGRYAAFMYRPVGKGSRSGKATTYKLVKEVHFVHRNKAKARAAKWFNTRHGNPTAVDA